MPESHVDQRLDRLERAVHVLDTTQRERLIDERTFNSALSSLREQMDRLRRDLERLEGRHADRVAFERQERSSTKLLVIGAVLTGVMMLILTAVSQGFVTLS